MLVSINAFLYFPLFEVLGITILPVNILVIGLLFVTAQLILRFISRRYKNRDTHKTITTLDGSEVPIGRLIKQFVWLLFSVLMFNALSIGNPNLDFHAILDFEFFRFDKFHLAIYHIFVVAVIYVGSRIVLNVMRIFLEKRLKGKSVLDRGTEFVYLQLTKYLLVTIGVIVIMRSLGIDLDLFLTATAFLLVGLGLGLQDIFKDFFAGLLLLFEGTVLVGDVIEIDRFDGKDNFVATIEKINIRTSVVRTREGKQLIIPNSHLAFQKVHNWNSSLEYTRFNVSLVVKYGSDVNQVMSILKEATEAHSMVSKTHDAIPRLIGFGDRGLEFDVVFWAKQSLNIEIHKSEIRLMINEEFKKHNIEFAFPQLDVHANVNNERQNKSQI